MAKNLRETTTVIIRAVTGAPEREPGGGWRVRGKVNQFIEKNGKTRRLMKLDALLYLRVEGFEDDVFETLVPSARVIYEERTITITLSPPRKLKTCEKTYYLTIAPPKQAKNNPLEDLAKIYIGK